MFASAESTALIAAAVALASATITGYFALKMEQVKQKAAAAEAAARRAERLAAQAKADFEWITHGGPEW